VVLTVDTLRSKNELSQWQIIKGADFFERYGMPAWRSHAVSTVMADGILTRSRPFDKPTRNYAGSRRAAPTTDN
jgi:hypothetical protein